MSQVKDDMCIFMCILTSYKIVHGSKENPKSKKVYFPSSEESFVQMHFDMSPLKYLPENKSHSGEKGVGPGQATLVQWAGHRGGRGGSAGGGKKSFSCSCSAFSTNCGYVWHIPSKSRRLWGPILKNLRKTDDVLQTGCCTGYSDPVRGGWSQLAPFHCGRTSLPGDKPATVLGRALHSASAPMFFQEKEIYRWPARESLKTMLAVGWTVERTKEGEALFQQRENEKLRSVSQASQV